MKKEREIWLAFKQKQILGQHNRDGEGEELKGDQLEVYIDIPRAKEVTEEKSSRRSDSHDKAAS